MGNLGCGRHGLVRPAWEHGGLVDRVEVGEDRLVDLPCQLLVSGRELGRRKIIFVGFVLGTGID